MGIRQRSWAAEARELLVLQEPSDFASAAMAVRPLFLVEGASYGEGYSAHVNDPARETEASAVESCVECLIDYEIDPPKSGKGVARYGPVSLVTPLGRLLGRRLEAVAENRMLGVRHAIRAALAMGYMGAVFVEKAITPGEPPPTTAPQHTWRQWTAQVNSDAFSVNKDLAALRDLYCLLAKEQFLLQLKAVDLCPRRGKRRLGWWYGERGMLLRFVQTGGLKLDPTSQAIALADRWPFTR